MIFLTRTGTIQPFSEGLPTGELLESLVHAPETEGREVRTTP